MIDPEDIECVELSASALDGCVHAAQRLSKNMIDRSDLHLRDPLERLLNILMGEIAEKMVLEWLHSQGKAARSAVDKTSGLPDPGHDIEVYRKGDGAPLRCSVKSSLSYKLDVPGILKVCKLATKQSELREINIQVYFWLSLDPEAHAPRTTVPSLKNAAIIGWFGKKDLLKFSTYHHELRETPVAPLKSGRTMQSLLDLLQSAPPTRAV